MCVFSILDKYILRKFSAILLFALVAFIIIFIIVNVIEKLDDFLDNNVPLIVFVQYYVYSIPYILTLTLPIAMLLASLFSMGTMSRHNELVAMKAAGISLYRIVAPLLAFSFMMCIFAFVFSEVVVPGASEKKESIADEFLEKKRERWRKRIDKVYVRDDKDRVVSMQYYRTVDQTGYAVRISKMNDHTLASRIDARKMVWEDSIWVLYDGYIRNFAAGIDKEAYPFDKVTLDETNLKPKDFAKIISRPEEMSYWDLEEFVTNVKRSGGNPDKWLTELHMKLAIPFANFIIVLFGAPLSSRRRRSSSATGFGISLAIVFIYFGIVKTGQTMGHNGFLPPFFAAWSANMLFAAAGIFTLLKTQK